MLGTLTGARTTPEAPDLQSALAEAADAGASVVAMEVSSHALELHRVDGTRFAVAVFTNLSRDHLDFHGTMEAYFEAKARLFEPDLAAVGLVNLDDPWGAACSTTIAIPAVGYSLDDAEDLELRADGSRFTWRGHRVDLALAGRFNVANALAAAEAALVLGIEPAQIAAGLGRAGPVRVASSWSRTASRSRWSSTTPTRPTASTRSWRRPRESSPTAGSSWCSAAAATGTGPSDPRWARPPTSWPTS